MKKVHLFERFSILFVLLLVFLSSYCLVFGTGETTYIIPPICNTTPTVKPNMDGVIPILNEVYFEVTAPCALGAHLTLINTTGPQPTMVIPDGQMGTDSIIRFPKFSATMFDDGKYALMIEVYYPTTLGIPSRFIGTTSNPKYFIIKNTVTTTTPSTTPPTSGSDASSNTTPVINNTNTTTTGTSTSGSGSTTSTINTVTEDLAARITKNGVPLTDAEQKTYNANLFLDAEQAILPEDLETAPTSTILTTENVDITEQGDTTSKVTLRGKAEPNTVIWLYIFSEPIVVEVKTDANGDWSYTLEQNLAAGKHEVYVAVKQSDGTVTAKSQPFSFFVGTAEAASVAEATAKSDTPTEKNYLIYYITLAASFIAIMVAVVFLLVTKSHIKKHEADAKA